MKKNIGNRGQHSGRCLIPFRWFIPTSSEDLTTDYWVQVHNHAGV